MVIDVLVFILLLMAVIKGYSKGLVVALFSFIAIIVGIVAALKFSNIVAGWLSGSTNVGNRWLPFLSFIIIITAVVFGVRMLAAFIQRSLQFAMLGWVNKLGGILLYAALYLIVLSVMLFFAEKIHILKPETLAASISYPVIKPFAPFIIDGIGSVIPFFKNMFESLSAFFDGLANKAS